MSNVKTAGQTETENQNEIADQTDSTYFEDRVSVFAEKAEAIGLEADQLTAGYFSLGAGAISAGTARVAFTRAFARKAISVYSSGPRGRRDRTFVNTAQGMRNEAQAIGLRLGASLK